MKYFRVKGEVSASYGEQTVFDRSQIPMHLVYTHLKFEGWQGSDLMKISPIHFATTKLANALIDSDFSGIDEIEDIKVEKSENFNEMYPDKQIPKCKILRIGGNKSDDIWVDKSSLFINEKVYDFLQRFNMTDVLFEEQNVI